MCRVAAALCYLYNCLCYVLCRALPYIGEDLGNFNYRENGRRVTDLITNQINKSNFTFVGVSVSNYNVHTKVAKNKVIELN